MKTRGFAGAFALGIAIASSGCTTTQADFRKNPTAVSKAALCRAFVTTRDFAYVQELTAESIEFPIAGYRAIGGGLLAWAINVTGNNTPLSWRKSPRSARS